ncbi:MAG TPA: hypothetical protein PLQ45_04245 [Anaerohalosphaeraceae bacterium]|jgi:hypothetical protein|nr:hypothetical protein [Anaerohalosphaeraceae bacterium]
MRKRFLMTGFLAAAGLLAGCGGSAGNSALWEKISRLQEEKNRLETQTERLEAENQQLLEQCSALDALDREIRLTALDRLVHIQIGKRSRLSDQNKDGQIDTLIILLEPVDQAGDIVKSPGQVHVSLWRLDPTAEEYLLAEWALSAEQIKKMWGHSLTGRYYRLTFALPAGVPKKTEDLTVRVEFTDYLTGKILKTQAPVRAR